MSNVEHPKYELVERSGNIEIRDYAPMIIAEAKVEGERAEAIRTGFRIIADYIFGNNAGAKKVAMTAPVAQQSGEEVAEKIAMTAPVAQQGDGNSWRVHFVMPSSYSLETLPKPNNPQVMLREIPAKRFAVIQFSGMGRDASLEHHTAALNDFVKANDLTPASQPTYAFYNPPWTLPFLRRNEILIELAAPAD